MTTYIEECLQRAREATKGPWIVAQMEDRTYIESTANIPDSDSNVLVDEHYLTELDAEFIAHARTDVPELVSRLKRAIEVLRLIKETNGYYEDVADELEAPMGGGK